MKGTVFSQNFIDSICKYFSDKYGVMINSRMQKFNSCGLWTCDLVFVVWRDYVTQSTGMTRVGYGAGV